MNTATAGAEVEQEQPEQQTPAEAEASFQAGFDKASGKTEADAGRTDDITENAEAQAASTPDQGAEAGEQDAAAAAAAAGTPAADPWEGVPAVVREKLESLEGLPGQVRNIAGHIGGLNNGVKELKAALDTAKAASSTGAAAPSQDAIAGAAGSTEKWEKLKKEFPDWGEALEERLALSGGQAVDVDALKSDIVGQTQRAIAAGMDEAEARAYIRMKHPTWKKTIATPEFKAWRSTQSEDINKLGASEDPDDAIKLLDMYTTHQQATAKAGQDRARQQRRLQGAVTPGGKTSGTANTGLSDEAAFERGAKRVLQQRAGGT